MMDFTDDARFFRALQHVLEHEGGFVDDPDDPGGATNWGISLRFLQEAGGQDLDDDGWLDGDLDHDGDVDADDIAKMTREQAAKIYFDQWWKRYDYGRFELMVAAKLFDLAVNMGHGQAVRILQRAVRGAGGPAVADDGMLGPKTEDAVKGRDAGIVRMCMRCEAAGFYRGLCMAKPVRYKWLTGWLTRAYW